MCRRNGSLIHGRWLKTVLLSRHILVRREKLGKYDRRREGGWAGGGSNSVAAGLSASLFGAAVIWFLRADPPEGLAAASPAAARRLCCCHFLVSTFPSFPGLSSTSLSLLLSPFFFIHSSSPVSGRFILPLNCPVPEGDTF